MSIIKSLKKAWVQKAFVDLEKTLIQFEKKINDLPDYCKNGKITKGIKPELDSLEKENIIYWHGMKSSDA